MIIWLFIGVFLLCFARFDTGPWWPNLPDYLQGLVDFNAVFPGILAIIMILFPLLQEPKY